MRYRFATTVDAVLLASMNQQLIVDEGHRNPMNLPQLVDRMARWLGGEYRAVIIEQERIAIGYALFREAADYVHFRQLFIARDRRRQGIGRNAVRWLGENAWPRQHRVRVEVLVGNTGGLEFWRSVGFADYCVTLEARISNQDGS